MHGQVISFEKAIVLELGDKLIAILADISSSYN